MTENRKPNNTTQITEIVLPGLVEPAGLQIKNRSLPAPDSGQVLVRVEVSGVSFAELAMRRGKYPGQPAFPFVPGYDLVGTIIDAGADVANDLVGTRIAAVTKTGGWSSHALLSHLDVVPVPISLDPALVETVLVNGVTAWQMLFDEARIVNGQTILVHGANGGVGTVLCQLARQAGIRVIGTAAPKHHAALRSIGVEPIDYNHIDLEDRIRHIAPEGVDAVFDHLGLDSARSSFRLLAHGGSLVCYGNASALNVNASMVKLFIALVSQIIWWNLMPNSKRATFYNFWGGHWLNPSKFRQRQRTVLFELFSLLENKKIQPVIAGRFPLKQAAAAMLLAESRTVQGKVVLVM